MLIVWSVENASFAAGKRKSLQALRILCWPKLEHTGDAVCEAGTAQLALRTALCFHRNWLSS